MRVILGVREWGGGVEWGSRKGEMGRKENLR